MGALLWTEAARLDLTRGQHWLFPSASRDGAEHTGVACLCSAALCPPDAGSQIAASRIERGA